MGEPYLVLDSGGCRLGAGPAAGAACRPRGRRQVGWRKSGRPFPLFVRWLDERGQPSLSISWPFWLPRFGCGSRHERRWCLNGVLASASAGRSYQVQACGYLGEVSAPGCSSSKGGTATSRLSKWLTRRCFVCRRLMIAHSIHETARCENTPLPIQLIRSTDKAA